MRIPWLNSGWSQFDLECIRTKSIGTDMGASAGGHIKGVEIMTMIKSIQ